MGNSLSNVNRISALASDYASRENGNDNQNVGITLSEVRDLTLWQLAVWPDSLQSQAGAVANQIGLSSFPGFGSVVSDAGIAMLRIEPLKFWVLGAELTECDANNGTILDLSHSRTHIRIDGPQATTVLNSYLPLDLREQSFPVGSVASTAFHHVGVTLWRSELGYELFIPRGFALSLWELLIAASEQYGLSVS